MPMNPELIRLIDRAGLARFYRFWLAAEEGTFYRVAQRLGLNAQATCSNIASQLHRLENDLGIPLIQPLDGWGRGRDSIRLTAAGHALHQRLSSVFRDLADGIAAASHVADLEKNSRNPSSAAAA